MNLDAVSLSILFPAFVAGLLVLATHVPLGQQVLQRGIVFIDLAVAQVAALGLMAADVMGWEPEGWLMQVVVTGAALIAALLLTWMEKHWPEIQEALIGTMFVLAASAGLMLLAHNPHGGEHLQEMLSGQILWVTWHDLTLLGTITVTLLLARFAFRAKLGRAGFYIIFAIAVTFSVHLVGVYLVFSSLILPALATRNWQPRHRLLGAYLLGAAAYLAGLAASALFDLPSGAVIVWSLAVLGLAANLCRRYDGPFE